MLITLCQLFFSAVYLGILYYLLSILTLDCLVYILYMDRSSYCIKYHPANVVYVLNDFSGTKEIYASVWHMFYNAVIFHFVI